MTLTACGGSSSGNQGSGGKVGAAPSTNSNTEQVQAMFEKAVLTKDVDLTSVDPEIQESFKGRDGKPVAALLRCQLETGRTHQIRVHLAHIGHPLMGDAVYGPHFKTKAGHLTPDARAALTALDRQALHAYLLALEHPGTGEFLHWEAPLPEDLLLLQRALEAAV